MTDPIALGPAELASAYRRGETNPVEVLDHCLDRIERFDAQLGSFTFLDIDGAQAAAHLLTHELAAGRSRGPLHGVPIAIKELFDVAGAPADYGSLTRAGLMAEHDCVVVSRLRAAGAIILGLTRSHEFGWGITTQHSRRGGTRNPWDHRRIPGGSSGGAAAAVAAGFVSAAIGTDTGGSIRIPSAFCGLAGIKPTFGRVPRTGLVPLAPSLDTVGVLAGRVGDLADILDVISGPDAGDPDSVVTGIDGPGDPLELAEVRLGHPPLDAIDDTDARRRFDGLLTQAHEQGAELVEVALPDREEFRATFATIQLAEAFDSQAHVLGLYPERSADYGDDVRGRIEAGAAVGIDEYLRASRDRAALAVALSTALDGVDALLAPIAPVAAPDVCRPDVAVVDGAEVALRDAVMGYVVPYNLTGRPSVAFRAGFDDDGLPWGAQVVTGRGRDGRALAVAAQLELGTPDHDRKAVLR